MSKKRTVEKGPVKKGKSPKALSSLVSTPMKRGTSENLDTSVMAI